MLRHLSNCLSLPTGPAGPEARTTKRGSPVLPCLNKNRPSSSAESSVKNRPTCAKRLKKPFSTSREQLTASRKLQKQINAQRTANSQNHSPLSSEVGFRRARPSSVVFRFAKSVPPTFAAIQHLKFEALLLAQLYDAADNRLHTVGRNFLVTA